MQNSTNYEIASQNCEIQDLNSGHIDKDTTPVTRPKEDRGQGARTISPIEWAKRYRDEFGWTPIPITRGDSRDTSRAGKAPILKKTEYPSIDDVGQDYLQKWWGGNRPSNMGILLNEGHIVIDLDSKADQGASVEAWLGSHPVVNQWPRERTRGGVHIHVLCQELPENIGEEAGRTGKIVRDITPEVQAEVFFSGVITTTPSVHPSGHRYIWETTGPLPSLTWEELCEALGVDGTIQPRRGREERIQKSGPTFRGDPERLDIVGLCKHLGIYGEPLADPGKHSIQCPWREEHSDSETPWSPSDSSTAILESEEGQMPGFCCLHASHADRGIQDLLRWAEEKESGVLEKFWPGVFVRTTPEERERPTVELPGSGVLVSDFINEVASAFAPLERWFNRNGRVVQIDIKSEPRKSPRNPDEKDELPRQEWVAFKPVDKYLAISEIEGVVTPIFYRSVKDGTGGSGSLMPVARSMGAETARVLLDSPSFIGRLPKIERIFEVPLPVIDPETGEITMPCRGYDKRFRSFLLESAPEIREVTLEDARNTLHEILKEFCFKGSQDVVHATAALLTPLCRGLFDQWTTRTPLFFYLGNRPRTGKDYLAGCTHVLYEGRTNEDPPLDGDTSELRKKITSALMGGRRRMHFSNCSGNLRNSVFEQILTNERWTDRILGGNSETTLPNEMEFSVSGNTGVTYSPDFAARTRIIHLHFAEENENGRTFSRPDLHGWIRRNRGEILSALWAMVRHWDREGRPSGPTPFTSFREWSEVVGGVMLACGLGDPCLPHENGPEIGGDPETADMRRLFALCFEKFPDKWVSKTEVRNLVETHNESPDNEPIFGYMDFSDQGGKIRFGNTLEKYLGRIFGGIQMIPSQSTGKDRPSRRKLKFIRKGDNPDGGNPVDGIFGKSGSVGSHGSLIHSSCLSDSGQNTVPSDENTAPRPADGVENTTNTTKTANYTLVDTPEGMLGVLGDIAKSQSAVALDLETFGGGKGDALDPRRGEVRLLALALPDRDPWVIDLKGVPAAVRQLEPLLERNGVIIHNALFDLRFLRSQYGVALKNVTCTYTASKLLGAGLPVSSKGNNLGELLSSYGIANLPKDQGASDWSGDLTGEQLQYAADDVRYLHKLADALHEKIQSAKLESVWKLESQVLPVAVEMYHHGFAVDREGVEQARKESKAEMEALASKAKEILGEEINLNSPKQLLPALEKLGIRIADTGKDTLAEVSHPAAGAILDYRKEKSRYQQLETVAKSVGADNRLHGTFKPLGADTGRFSCTDPNLQSIGRGTIRKAFIAPEGRRLVCADYSQIDLRVAAAHCGETRMLEGYARGEDLHTLTASLVLDKRPEEVSPEERQMAKAVNFGLLYGQSAEGLVKYAKTTYGVEMTQSQSERFHNRFFEVYPGMKAWHSRTRELATEGLSEARSRLGRRRLLPQGEDAWWHRFSRGLNSPIQGGAADVLKTALVGLGNALPASAFIVSNIHDEIIVECDEADSASVQGILEDVMTRAMKEIYPEVACEVEAKIGSTWDEAK